MLFLDVARCRQQIFYVRVSESHSGQPMFLLKQEWFVIQRMGSFMQAIKSRLSAAIFCLLFSVHAFSADISLVEKKGILISGKIENGDYRKFQKFLDAGGENLQGFYARVFLNSRGGNVAEAMKIANLIEKGYTITSIRENEVCFSACVLLWAGGVERDLLGKLGLHRISNSKRDLSVTETENSISPTSQVVESYLLRMGIPRLIIDKMNETLSTDLFIVDLRWVSKNDLNSAMSYRPSYIEVAEKNCGKNPYILAMKTGLGLEGLNQEAALQWEDCTLGVRIQNVVPEFKKFESLLKTDS